MLERELEPDEGKCASVLTFNPQDWTRLLNGITVRRTDIKHVTLKLQLIKDAFLGDGFVRHIMAHES